MDKSQLSNTNHGQTSTNAKGGRRKRPHSVSIQSIPTMTKAQALKEFRDCGCVVRGDRIATAENWNNYTDFLCKDRQITDKQYNNWTNPF